MRSGLLISILLVLVSPQEISRKSKLTEKSYPAILKALQKLPVETYWKEIPWRPSLGEAVEEARIADKPILLWVMNGHPCGMT